MSEGESSSSKRRNKEKEEELFPSHLPRSKKSVFRLGVGTNGQNEWVPLENQRTKFSGWAPVGNHIAYVGKNWEFAQDEEEEEEGDDEEAIEGQFDDADDISRPDVQKQLKSYRNAKRQKADDEGVLPYEFPDDGYDYSQHLRAPGGGLFIPLDVDYYKKVSKAKGIEDPAILATHDTDAIEDKEIDEQLYADAPEADAAGDLDDDFIIQAHGGELIEDESQLPDPLEIKARKQTEKRLIFGGLEANDFNEDDYEIEEEWEEYDDAEYDQEQLEEAFDKTLSLYDDDDIGAVDDADPQLLAKNVDVTVYEKQLLEEFPSMTKARSRYHYVDPIPANNDEVLPEVDVVEEVESSDEEETEEVEIPRVLKWDAETILSAYSNTENHPTLIDAPTNPKRIQLSKKTGMPLGILPAKPPKKPENEPPAENKGKARGEETAEQKKERKKQAKEEKKHAREQKKAYKVAFKQEELRQTNVLQTQHVAKKVVVKY